MKETNKEKFEVFFTYKYYHFSHERPKFILELLSLFIVNQNTDNEIRIILPYR